MSCLVGVGISAGSAAVVSVTVLFRVSVMSFDSETETVRSGVTI